MSIQVERLSHVYAPGTPQERMALRNVSLRIEDGACAAIVGVTGSGKSTLVQHFNGLLRPSTGHVLVEGIALAAGRKPRKAELVELRRRVSLLFQFPEAQLFAPTVYDDIAFGPRQLGLNETAIRERVLWALEAVALPADQEMLTRSPFALSGGQKRRVALAGVLAMRPRVLVLDEPSAGLDAEARDELYARLAALRARERLTIVLVTHDMGEVARLATDVFVLAEGELRLAGSPRAVFGQAPQIAEAGLVPPPLAETLTRARAAGLAVGEPAAYAPDVVASALAAAMRQRRPRAKGHGDAE
ncbi:MAG TPA: energy-coupling factor transporter ATPase [Ktedonobacterales bacterium]|nr:energy-coupling factor transporter ATPase [Ktedonobacterales bacterium]